MNKLEKFKTVRDLKSALLDEAGIYDYDSRAVVSFGERTAEKMAEDYFGTIPSNHSPAYKKLLEKFRESVEDYDYRRD